MELSIKTVLLFIGLLASGVMRSEQGVCERSSEKGPFKLKHSESNITKIGEIKVKGILYIYPKTAEIEIYNRWRYSRKCYTHWNFDQTCTERLTEEVPSSSELIVWKGKGACMVGDTCLLRGSCWGSWAERCDKKYVTYEEVGSNHPIEKSEADKKRLYHSCTQKWRCLHNSGNTPIYLRALGNGTVRPYISNESGDLIVISPELYRGEVKIPNSDAYIKVRHSIDPIETREVILNCYNSNKHISCYTTGIRGIENTPFIMNSDRTSGQIHNYGIVISDPPESLSCRNPQTVEERSWCQSLFYASNRETIAKTPTIEDILSIIETSSLSQMVTSSIIKEIETFQNKMSHNQFLMMKSMARLDPFLLGDIMNQSIVTTWFNEEIFYTTKCNDPRINKDSNCNGRSIYKDGYHQPISKSDRCINIGGLEIKTIIMDDIQIDELIHFSPLSPQASTGGWSVWEQYKSPAHETVEKMHTIESKVSEISRMLDIGSIFFNSAYKWWRGLIDVISMLNIILFIVLIRRN